MVNSGKKEKMLKNAVCVLIQKGPFVLAVSRKDDPSDFGLPGGKVDLGEDLKEAITREVKEETGLEIFNLKQVFEEDDTLGYRVITFTCDYEGEIYTEEAGVVRWVDPRVLFEGTFGYYNRVLFQHLNLVPS